MKNTYRRSGVVLGLGLALVMAVYAAEAAPVVTKAAAPDPAPMTGTVTIRTPAGPPHAQVRDPATGQVVPVACGTCHTTRTPNPANAGTNDLDLFHQGLRVAHGSNVCLSCHNPADYGSLHLADGRRVEFTDVVTLCSQCHGPQWRDYQHGAHGGMNGHWDLTKGDRTRQGCTGCHDPHTPKYQGAHPALPPRDRFLESHHD